MPSKVDFSNTNEKNNGFTECIKYINAMDDIIFISDTDFNIKECNKSFEKSFNLTVEEVRNKKCYNIVHNLDRPCDYCPYKKTLEDKETHRLERFDPNIGFFSLFITSPILDSNGNQIGILHIIRDITDQRKLEDEIKKFKFILDYANFGIVITDLEGNLVYINKYFADVHGFKPKLLLGKDLSIFHTRKQMEKVSEIIDKLREEDSYYDQEVWHQHRNKSVFPMLMSGMVIKDDKGNDLYLVLTAIDLSERKEEEEQLIQSEKLASIGMLAAGVAHEINNPIMGIINYAQILIEELKKLDIDINSRPFSFLRGILKEGKRISNIISDLLTYSRKSPGNFIYKDIIELVNSSISLLMPKFKTDHIDIETEFEETLPKIPVKPQNIEQVIINVLQNSIDALNKKFGDFGPKKIIIKIDKKERKNEKYIRIFIKDNGGGIKKEHLKKVFDPFFTTKIYSKEHGTGLGLSISKNIIKDHGGEIEISSKPGKFTIVEILLPIEKKE
ncbi:MAG: PAS domain S-box protein [Candidatus Helarchaeota archaeon]